MESKLKLLEERVQEAVRRLRALVERARPAADGVGWRVAPDEIRRELAAVVRELKETTEPRP